MNRRKDDSTVILTDIKSALQVAENEASEKPAALVGVGGETNGYIFDLNNGDVSVGRGPECTICIDVRGISRNHMIIQVSEEEGFHRAIIKDNNSRNGTYLNNKKLEQAVVLNKGDIIKLGSLAFKYLPKGDLERLTYDKLQEEANTDGLTKCYNKAYFNRTCELEVKKCRVTGSPLSLIVFDIDHFKLLNDNHGHDAGDYVLKELATVIRKHGVRDRDIFARYGGEEFVILLPQTNLKQGFEIAERLRKLIEEYKFVYENKRLPVTASIGIADYRQGVETGTDLFKRADTSVYKSKEEGRNQVNFFRG